MDAQKRRLYATMLDSLSRSFALVRERGEFICSFNPDDVADMLREVSEEITPHPELIP